MDRVTVQVEYPISSTALNNKIRSSDYGRGVSGGLRGGRLAGIDLRRPSSLLLLRWHIKGDSHVSQRRSTRPLSSSLLTHTQSESESERKWFFFGLIYTITIGSYAISLCIQSLRG